MGIETPADLSGSECSFTSAIIAVEELARVDPSVAVLCDVHNTLVNTVLRLYGSKEIQEKWLPDLATSKVGLRVGSRWRRGRGELPIDSADVPGWKLLPD
jgi:alkylation response protein AidB-like acyl-CoA dehydrogenase